MDIGANIGYFSMLLAKKVGPSGKVVAIEALPHLADQVRRHCAENGFDNVDVVNKAVNVEKAEVMMFGGPATNCGASTTREDYGYRSCGTVEGMPLSNILSSEDRRRTTIVKCDIEGAELPIMNQLLDELGEYPNLKIVAVEANATDCHMWKNLFDRFKENGFCAFQVPTLIAETWEETLNGRPIGEPTKISALPVGTSDLLFVRECNTTLEGRSGDLTSLLRNEPLT